MVLFVRGLKMVSRACACVACPDCRAEFTVVRIVSILPAADPAINLGSWTCTACFQGSHWRLDADEGSSLL